MEISKTGGRYCRWCGWHVVGVVAIAFGSTLLIFFPDFFLNQLLMVSHAVITRIPDTNRMNCRISS